MPHYEADSSTSVEVEASLAEVLPLERRETRELLLLPEAVSLRGPAGGADSSGSAICLEERPK